jgi:hypothetical protein
MPADAADAIGAAARLYDLSVVLQPMPEYETFDNALPKEILLHSGGPVLFVPHIFRGAFNPKRIGICWDGSRLAARALRDARPFLAQADSLVGDLDQRGRWRARLCLHRQACKTSRARRPADQLGRHHGKP